MHFQNKLSYARQCDENDPLGHYRSQFHFPVHNGQPVIYMAGNSLGLQPLSTKTFIEELLSDWEKWGVEGHFKGSRPWWNYHEALAPLLADIVGGKPEEITVMNGLTVNLHLLLVSFYRPTKKRFKILCEEKAFPSDIYALKSQLRTHGLKTEDALIEVKREANGVWQTENVLEEIKKAGDELALVFMGGVNYYNGQVFEIEKITEAAHQVGALAGWDLAHAAGNIKLELHHWNVDFAAWCSYKYMNAGPGSAAAIFVHKKHLGKSEIPRFEGWWGHNKKRRFLMEPNFEALPTAEAWQLSNIPVFSVAPYLASLQLFKEAGMEDLIHKSSTLTAYLQFILKEIEQETGGDFEIITPPARGCQLSVFLHGQGKKLYNYIREQGVMADWREPNVIRLAPVPFYNSFEDVYRFGQILLQAMKKPNL